MALLPIMPAVTYVGKKPQINTRVLEEKSKEVGCVWLQVFSQGVCEVSTIHFPYLTTEDGHGSPIHVRGWCRMP
jgi:hypothetical protein